MMGCWLKKSMLSLSLSVFLALALSQPCQITSGIIKSYDHTYQYLSIHSDESERERESRGVCCGFVKEREDILCKKLNMAPRLWS